MVDGPEKQIPESQLRRWLADTLMGIAEQLGAHPSVTLSKKREWFDTAEAAVLLGCSPRQLRQSISCGLFRAGSEVRDKRKPNGRKPRWQFHVEKCNQRLKERPEKRKAF